MNRYVRYFLSAVMLMLAGSVSAQSANGKCDKCWLEQGEWRHGFKADPDPSVNISEFRSQYNKNKELYDLMFAFLATEDLAALPLGKTDIVPGRLSLTVSEYTPREAAKVGFESHRKFVDLQYVLRGNEKMGVGYNAAVKKEYNPQRDVAWWAPEKVEYYPATPATFFLFFPADQHQPSVLADGDPIPSRKLVFKIEYKD